MTWHYNGSVETSSGPTQHQRWKVPLLLLLGAGLIRVFWEGIPLGRLHDDACFTLVAMDWLGLVENAPARDRALGPSLAVLPYFLFSSEVTSSIRWIPTCMSVGAVALYHQVIRRRLDERVSLPLTLCLLLSPGFLLSAGTVMGEPLLNLATAVLLLLLLTDPFKGRPWLMALCLGLAFLSRTEGICLALALGVACNWTRLKRNWKLVLGLGALAGVGFLFLVFFSAMRVHMNTIFLKLASYGSPLEYLRDWLAAYGKLMGTVYLGLGPVASWAALACAGFLVLLALVGWFRLGTSPWDLTVKLTLPLQLLAVLAWPYPDPRYLLALWPLLVLCAALALPRKVRTGAAWLGVVFLALYALPQLHRDVESRRSERELKRATTSWVAANVPVEAGLVSEQPCTMHLLSGHAVLPFGDRYGYSGLMEYALEHPALYLAIENNIYIRDTQGGQYTSGLVRLQPWVAQNRLWELAYENQTSQIYKLEVTPELASSLQSLRQAVQLDWAQPGQAEKAESLLREARASGLDLPTVESSLATLLLSTGREEEGRRLLEGVLQRYPFDFSSLYNLAQSDLAVGRTGRARSLLQEGIKLATRFGERAMARRMSTLLQNIPPQKD